MRPRRSPDQAAPRRSPSSHARRGNFSFSATKGAQLSRRLPPSRWLPRCHPAHLNARRQQGGGGPAELQVEIFKLALAILAASLVQHPVNLKAFETTVGWKGLQDAITIATNAVVPPDHVFGSLLGLAVADVATIAGRIVSTRRFLRDQYPKQEDAHASTAEEVRTTLLTDRVREQWTPVPTVVFPQTIRILVQLLLSDRRCKDGQARLFLDDEGTSIVLHTLRRLVATSRRNQTALVNIGLSALLLDATLPIGVDDDTPSSSRLTAIW